MQGQNFSMPLLLVVLAMTGVGRIALSDDDPGEGREKTLPTAPSFQSDIRPLLGTKCWRCHGEQAPKAELDLTTLAGILKGGESGPVVVPGKPDESALYEKVHERAMPPGKKAIMTITSTA